MTKVMLVEDDDNLREIYGARLIAEGYEIISARDGEEALALAVKEKPDLLISDVMMPKISGFDMLDILRSSPETKNAKVIMMTALSQIEDKDRADKLGADRYLVKSQVTLEDVVRVAKEVLEGETAQESTPDEPLAPISGVDISVPDTSQPAPTEPTTPAETPAPTPVPASEPAAAPVATPTDDNQSAATTTDPANPVDDTAGDAPVTDPAPSSDAVDQPASPTPVPEPVATPLTEAPEVEPATEPAKVEESSEAPTEPTTPAETPAPAEEVKQEEIAEVIDDAQSTSSELKTVEDQINEFVTQTEQDPEAPEAPLSKEIQIGEDGSFTRLPADEADSETAPDATPKDTPATETPVLEASAPAEEVKQEETPAPAPASDNTESTTETATELPVATPPTETPEVEPAAEPAKVEETSTESSDNKDESTKEGDALHKDKKVIQPLSDMNQKGPDLNALLAKEAEKEQLNQIITQAGVTPAPDQQSGPQDPNNISL